MTTRKTIAQDALADLTAQIHDRADRVLEQRIEDLATGPDLSRKSSSTLRRRFSRRKRRAFARSRKSFSPSSWRPFSSI